MRKFNPEKELYKIQHGRRDKIFIGAFLLLLIISIGSTYALYQVRYSKRIIYTKVAPFSNKDIELAVKLEKEDGAIETSNEFPNEYSGYDYEKTECDIPDITTTTWNVNSWSLIIDTKGPNKCTVTFKYQAKLLNEIIVADNKTIFDDETDQHNIRYVGKNSSNYIWFNCNDYNNPSSDTCEKWRIIGLFKNVTKAEGGTEKLVKIIRDEKLPNYYAWDNKPRGTGTSTSEYGSNNWSDSRLMMLLNPGYESNELNDTDVTGSLYWNGDKGNCSGATDMGSVSVPNGTTIECDFTTAGLKNETTKNMIEQVTWNLGGRSDASATASQFYTDERGNTGGNKGSAPTTWDGYIGLMYPSDYGYAAEKSCWTMNLSKYNDCTSKNWLYKGYQWTLSPLSTYVYHSFYMYSGGWIGQMFANEALPVRPTLYLKSGIKALQGVLSDGSNEHPYVLVP